MCLPQIRGCTIGDDIFESAHRGMFLDTARHFHPAAALRCFLLALSFAKLNVFHWHIADEESFPRKWPHLWNSSYSAHERYSQADIADIVEFATSSPISTIRALQIVVLRLPAAVHRGGLILHLHRRVTVLQF